MPTNTRLIFTHALSPLHAGTGQGVGVIDLPIAREKATGLPYLPGSSLKGTLRAGCEEGQRTAVFGPEPKDGVELHAGAALFSDQRLLLLPIRSLAGTFAWVTSPYVLRRFRRDLDDAGLTKPSEDVPGPKKVDECIVANNTELAVNDNNIYLEDLDLTCQREDTADAWAAWIGEQVFPDDKVWQGMLRERFCVVHDDVLNFLLTTATEVTARIRLEEQHKTVSKGGLWYEEALPTETILVGMLLATAARTKEKQMDANQVIDVLAACIEKPLQLGGKTTVGRGLCRVRLTEGAA